MPHAKSGSRNIETNLIITVSIESFLSNPTFGLDVQQLLLVNIVAGRYPTVSV
jgi:hypothetical protein